MRTRESLRLALVDKAYVFVRIRAASTGELIYGRIDAGKTARSRCRRRQPPDVLRSAAAGGYADRGRARTPARVCPEPAADSRADSGDARAQRKSIQDIVELGPGSIVKFDKTCDEPLELSVGDRTIALGEVVKVGDKFGLRISGLVK